MYLINFRQKKTAIKFALPSEVWCSGKCSILRLRLGKKNIEKILKNCIYNCVLEPPDGALFARPWCLSGGEILASVLSPLGFS